MVETEMKLCILTVEEQELPLHRIHKKRYTRADDYELIDFVVVPDNDDIHLGYIQQTGEKGDVAYSKEHS